MPTYRFEFLDDKATAAAEVMDVVIEREDDPMQEAAEALRETMVEALLGGINPGKWTVRVYDADDTLIGSISFADAVRRRADRH